MTVIKVGFTGTYELTERVTEAIRRILAEAGVQSYSVMVSDAARVGQCSRCLREAVLESRGVCADTASCEAVQGALLATDPAQW